MKNSVLSENFDGQRLVNRQRSVNRLLKEEFKEIHALSLSARTPAEHDESNRHSTPPCAGKS